MRPRQTAMEAMGQDPLDHVLIILSGWINLGGGPLVSPSMHWE